MNQIGNSAAVIALPLDTNPRLMVGRGYPMEGMMLNPQELMDLPGYGRAKEYLIDQGQWDDPALRHQEIARKIADMAEGLAERMEERE